KEFFDALCGTNLLPEVTTKQLHTAVHITHPQSEHQHTHASENFAERIAQKRVGSLGTSTRDEGVLFAERQKEIKILRMELSVAIHERNPLRGGTVTSRAHRDAVSAVFFQVDNFETRHRLLQARQERQRTVLGSVIHHNNLAGV